MIFDEMPTQKFAEESAIVESLRLLGQFTPEEARHFLLQDGLDGLRLAAAQVLWNTRPLSTGEIADLVGVNRGMLLRSLLGTQWPSQYESPQDLECTPEAIERRITAYIADRHFK